MSRWVGVLLLLAGTPCFAQSESRKAIGLTPWGDPDLSGIWDFATLTPLQRPPGVDVETFTEEQAAEFEREFEQQLNRRLTVHAPRLLDYGASVNEDRRTSLIVDPLTAKSHRSHRKRPLLSRTLRTVLSRDEWPGRTQRQTDPRTGG